MHKKINAALISVFYKDGLETLVQTLHQHQIHIYTTGGTQQFIEQLGIPCIPVESVTDYPSILGGRVKTLHPKIFGGILGRRNLAQDIEEMKQFQIKIDPRRLQALNLTLSSIADSLQSANMNVGGGYISKGEEQIVIRGESQFKNAED